MPNGPAAAPVAPNVLPVAADGAPKGLAVAEVPPNGPVTPTGLAAAGWEPDPAPNANTPPVAGTGTPVPAAAGAAPPNDRGGDFAAPAPNVKTPAAAAGAAVGADVAAAPPPNENIPELAAGAGAAPLPNVA